MRIAILADALDMQYAGVHIYLHGLLTALAAADRKNEYLLVRPKAGGEFEGMRELVVPVRAGVPGHRRWRAFRTIPQILVKEGVDVVVEPAHFGPFGLPDSIKRVTIIHDLTPVLFPGFHVFPSGLVHKIFLPGILKKASCVIANSAHTQKDLEQYYPVSKGKISVVRPGREAIFRPVSDPSVLEKYGIRQPYLLCTGTLEPRKNLLTLLRAFEQFRRQTAQPVQLVFTGKKGWKTEAFFAALEQSPFRQDVVLTGYVERPHLPVLYSMARLFVYPSLYEGFGLPVLEAMACGAPVLISGTSSLPEVGGLAAQYFDPGNVTMLAEKLLELNNNESKRLEMSQLSSVQAGTFSWEEAARQFMLSIGQLPPA